MVEAHDRVGGRTWNATSPAGHAVERGGQWIGPTQDRILALADEVGVETLEQYAFGAARMAIDGFDDAAQAEVALVMAELERMAAELPADAPWTAVHALDRDSQTLHTWLEAHPISEPARAYVHVVMAELFTAEPAEVSLLHVLNYVRSAGSCDHLLHVAQERRFVAGSQEISVRVAQRLGDGAVRLGHPVRRIMQDGRTVVAEADGLTVTARRAVVAVPVALCDRITYEPRLPVELAQVHQRVAPGTVFKIHCLYERPFWRDEGWSGLGVRDEGLVSVTFDSSPPAGTPGIIVAFVEADNARQFRRLAGDCPAQCRGRVVGRALRPAGGQSRGLRRDRLVRRSVDEGLLRLEPPPWRMDPLRGRPPRAIRPRPLGWHRAGHGLDELHGRCGALGRAGGGRGARRVDRSCLRAARRKAPRDGRRQLAIRTRCSRLVAPARRRR